MKVKDLISQGVVELKMFDTKPEHAKEYGLDSVNPLYVQSLCITENQRLKGIGNKVLQYIDDYAIKNGHDLVFGHITQKAEFTKDNRETFFCDTDMIKNWLHSKGYAIQTHNNDFHKVINNNNDIRFEQGGLIAPNGKPRKDRLGDTIFEDIWLLTRNEYANESINVYSGDSLNRKKPQLQNYMQQNITNVQHKNRVQKAINENKYEYAIENGFITKERANEIIKSAELDIRYKKDDWENKGIKTYLESVGFKIGINGIVTYESVEAILWLQRKYETIKDSAFIVEVGLPNEPYNTEDYGLKIALLDNINNLSNTKKGLASFVLDKIIEGADLTQTTLQVIPKQMDNLGLTTNQLIDWYSKRGFKPINDGIVYERKASKIDSNELKMNLGGLVGNTYTEIMYRVILSTETTTDIYATSTDLDDITSDYNSISPSDFDNPNSNSNTKELQSITKEYEFIGGDDFEAQDYIEDLDNTDFWTLTNEDTNDIESESVADINKATDEMIDEIREFIKEEYNIGGRYAEKYMTISVDDEDGEFITDLNIRTGDHSQNTRNNDSNSFNLSFVIANLNATQNRFIPLGTEYYFDDNNDIEDIKEEIKGIIDEKIEEIKENREKFNGGGMLNELEDNTYLYKINTELTLQGKGKWESDFEIIDNRDGQEFGEDASNWIVYNNVSGTSVDAKSKKDAEDIIKNAPAYEGMWNEGEPIDFSELNPKQQENHIEEFNRQKGKTKNIIDTRIKGLQIALKLAKAENKDKIEKRIKGLEIAQKIQKTSNTKTNQDLSKDNNDSIEETNKYNYLMTLEEYQQSGIIDLLKEYKKFVRKNEKSLYSDAYGSIGDFRTLEEYIELGDKSPLYSNKDIMGLPNKKSIEQTIKDKFIDRKTRYGKDPNDYYEVASKEVIEQNKKFREKILKYFALDKYGQIKIDNDELKSNKRAVRNAMENKIYANLILDGKLSVDRLEQIADSVGVRITKETYSADKGAELKEYLKKIKVPQQNYEALLEFGKMIRKDLLTIRDIAYKKEYKRYSTNILESVGKTIESDRLSLLIPFWSFVVNVDKKASKNNVGWYNPKYDYTILSVKNDWEKNLEIRVDDIIEELMFKIVTTIISSISFVKIPFKSVVSKEVKIGVKGFEGVYEINFTDGSKFDLVTQGIEAGGYNIQSFHYRYISKIEKMILPNGEQTKDDSHFRIYKEIKKYNTGGGVGKMNYADGRKFRIRVK